MLKLLIVDDEKRTRDGLKMCLPWASYGIGEIREADDGHTALETALAFKPDIVLSDVRMPTMTGIELAMRTQAELPACKFVFISGYADKEYLKAAIRLKAVSYIEKPISVKELEECIRNVTEACRKEAEQTRRLAEAAAKLETSTLLLQRDFAVQLAKGSPGAEELDRLLAASGYELPLDGKYVSVLFRINFAPDMPVEQTAGRRGELAAAIARAMDERRLCAMAGTIDGVHLVAHALLAGARSLDDVRAAAERIAADFAGTCGPDAGPPLFAGIGMPVRGMAHIRLSYQSALTALEQVFFLGGGRIAAFDERRPAHAPFDEDMEHRFAAYLPSCDKAVFPYIASIGSALRRQDAVPVDDVRRLFYRLLMALYGEAQNKFLGRYMEDRKEEVLWHRVADALTLNELLGFLESEVRAYFDAVASVGTQSRVVHETIRYIQRNYSKGGFTISDIAGHLHLTPAYLSQLFKKDTGLTINDYVNAYKIDKAKELLADRSVKLFEIASLTGYSDAKYFAKTFKRITGITPSDFREKSLK
ncbi:response regulator [Paenibacillus sacheonensis]|uniref:Response regulator n=1 Tax=Paenibacillus sacheonensis TaxID=742054 RepID=A0A7X4YJM3_9BACL|nr:response regulator [Paenibacillus sacheonensis]MBM7564193.1 two-component system response regulator YesN [Paenibacillus sacheonensis]NBC67482.1 response regulator [Paenibacillus sacheonensis]